MSSMIKLRKVLFGNNVSHAHNKTRRKFKSNVHKHRIYMADLGGFVEIKCPNSVLRSFEKGKSLGKDLRNLV